MEALTYTHWILLGLGALIMGMSKGDSGAGNLTVAIFALVGNALGPVGVPLSWASPSSSYFC